MAELIRAYALRYRTLLVAAASLAPAWVLWHLAGQ
jgi:hypothetical protein